MKELDKKLGIDDVVPVATPAPAANVPVPVKASEQPQDYDAEKVDADFDTARENIINTLSHANDAMQLMFEIAKEKEDAKSFEALNALLKTITETSKDLLEVHKKRKEIKKTVAAKEETTGPSITIGQQAVFVGTGKEIQDQINKSLAASKKDDG